MHRQRTIAIVCHATTTSDRMQMYWIQHCAKAWKQMGVDVSFVNGPEFPQEADLIIPQVEISVLPEEYRCLLSAKITVINRSIADVRRKVFSRNLVSLHDEYAGPVIVKTDANCGGQPERELSKRVPRHGRLLRSLQTGLHALRRMALTRSASRLVYTDLIVPMNYPVYQSKRDVPRGVFTNANLVVEKFLPETDGRFYYIRGYYFLGNEGIAIRMKSDQRIAKAHEGIEIDYVPIDARIEAIRRTLGFDYGKFDYVIHDGQAVLLDINNTPTCGPAFSQEMRDRIGGTLAKGISNWLPQVGR